MPSGKQGSMKLRTIWKSSISLSSMMNNATSTTGQTLSGLSTSTPAKRLSHLERCDSKVLPNPMLEQVRQRFASMQRQYHHSTSVAGQMNGVAPQWIGLPHGMSKSTKVERSVPRLPPLPWKIYCHRTPAFIFRLTLSVVDRLTTNRPQATTRLPPRPTYHSSSTVFVRPQSPCSLWIQADMLLLTIICG